MNSKRFTASLFLAAGLAGLLAGCGNRRDQSKAIFDPSADLGMTPEITSILPPGRAEGGILRITLRGRGFLPDTSGNKVNNLVYFNNSPAQVMSCSDTEIVVLRPNMVGDSLTVKVLVKGACAIARMRYGISEAARLYGKQPKKNWIEFITVDRDENVYLLNKTKDVARLDTGEYTTPFGMRKYGGKATDMKYGSNGSIYMSQLNNPTLYKIAPEGGDTQKVANFTVNINGFDFDANGIAYGGASKTGLSALLPDLTARTVGDYGDVSIILSGVKVYRNNVYVADDKTIWKSPITGTDGSIGPKEKVFEMRQAAAYADSTLLSFAMGEDGTLVIAADHPDAVFLCHPDGSVEPLYKGIMMQNSGLLAWGFGHYLYLNMKQDPATNDLMRIDTGMDEAPKN
jgi:hypothetical protein